ncbi:MAG: hypothetical protein EHM34_06220 [Nitrosopumilales archaeon]|nr:MAG: hypothetical protein EHM34_06220 [Nitrosopumilales archaeon]
MTENNTNSEKIAQNWYRISEHQIENLKNALIPNQIDEMIKNIKRQKIKIDHEGIHDDVIVTPRQHLDNVIQEIKRRKDKSECGLTLTDYKDIIALIENSAPSQEKTECKKLCCATCKNITCEFYKFRDQFMSDSRDYNKICLFSPMWVLSTVGCASHSDILLQIEFTNRELGVIALALPKLDILMPDFCEGHTDDETLEILDKICNLKAMY